MFGRAPEALIHATAVTLGESAIAFDGPRDAAVLLCGDSGSGKSDVALRMIAAGATLLSDDQTILFVQDGRIYASAPDSIAGLLEARGVGILRLPRALPVPVVLAVKLTPQENFARLPEPAYFTAPQALKNAEKIPLLTLASFQISTPVKIAAAAAAAAHGTLFGLTP